MLNGTVDIWVTDARGYTLEDLLRRSAGKTWWTIGELCDLARCYMLRHTDATNCTDFEGLPKREQYLVMEYAAKDLVKSGVLQRALGSDDGREVGAYALTTVVGE